MSNRWLAVAVALTMLGCSTESLVAAVEPSGEQTWAFFELPQGPEALSPPIEQYADPLWLHLAFSEYSGPRVRVAVLAAENSSSFPGDTNGIAKRLARSLAGTHRFEVSPLGGPDAARWIAEAQYWIRAVPAPFDEDGVIRMTFRIVDAAGKQVIFAMTESAEVNASTSFSEALEICINKGTYRLGLWLSQRPWTGSVVAVDHGRVVINAGALQGLKANMQLRTLIHQEVVDPESGEFLGAAARESGLLEVVEVEAEQAVALVVEGCEELSKGDRVELMQ